MLIHLLWKQNNRIGIVPVTVSNIIFQTAFPEEPNLLAKNPDNAGYPAVSFCPKIAKIICKLLNNSQ